MYLHILVNQPAEDLNKKDQDMQEKDLFEIKIEGNSALPMHTSIKIENNTQFC